MTREGGPDRQRRGRTLRRSGPRIACRAPASDDPSMRHAVVTGGGTGIGLAVARRLLAGGDEVTIVGRRREVLEDASGGSMRGEVADLQEPDEVQALADRLGAVDVLVLNAGGNVERRGE